MSDAVADAVAAGGDLRSVRVAWVGHGNRDFIRNDLIIKALRGLGAEVVEVCEAGAVPARYRRMWRGLRRAAPDVVLVGYPGYSDVPLAWLYAGTRRRPLVFDAFVSLHDTYVADRRRFAPESVRARFAWGLDRLGVSLPDLVLCDTDANADHMARVHRVPRARFRRVWVGADERLRPCGPREAPGRGCQVVFVGSYIPLHGVEHILRAADTLRRRHGSRAPQFTLVGDGQTYPAMRELADVLGLTNVRFLPPVPFARFPEAACRADVLLGVFGTSRKATAVVPRKVFDGLALGLPIVTGDSHAAREVLRHGIHAWLCPPGDPVALADAIEHLWRHPELRSRIAHEGRALFEREFAMSALQHRLGEIVREALGGGSGGGPGRGTT